MGHLNANSLEKLQKTKLKIGFVLLPNFTLTAFASFLDIIRIAADTDTRSRKMRASWKILSENGRAVRSSSDVLISDVEPLSDPSQFDYLCLVGGILPKTIHVSLALKDFFEKASKNGATLVGICTGTVYLEKMGLMKGRHFGVAWYHQKDILEHGSASMNCSTDNLYVVSNRRITSTTTNSNQYVAAWIIAMEIGEKYAEKALRIIGIDHMLPPNYPQQHSIADPRLRDPVVVKAVTIMRRNIAYSKTIQNISFLLNVSCRTLNRKFQAELNMSPKQYYLIIRLNSAAYELCHTVDRISVIAARCGFESAEYFSRVFKNKFMQTPSELRMSVQGSGAWHRPPQCHHVAGTVSSVLMDWTEP